MDWSAYVDTMAALNGFELDAGLRAKIALRWAGAPIALAGGWMLLNAMA